MVATRRQVQAEPDENAITEQDPDLILKKKPVRRATAKTADAKTTTKPKTTRGKKAAVEQELEPEPEISEAEVPALKQKAGRPKKAAAKAVTEPEPEAVEDEIKLDAKPKRATKVGSVRGKRGAAVIEPDIDEHAQDASKPSKTVKAASVRGKKGVLVVAEEEVVEEAAQPVKAKKSASVRGKKAAVGIEAPALEAPEEPKPARQTRGAASKPQPLSPKKITQVSKAQTRNTRGANEKPAAKATSKKAAVKARSTRNRAVSDENEDIEMLNTSTAVEDVDDEVIELSSTPKKTKSARAKNQTKKQTNPAPVDDVDLSMSSRPTTPTDSAQQSFNTVETEEEPRQVEVSDEEDVPSVKEDSGGSEDELCGPKTPMRRSSPSAQARFQSSIQRSIRKDEGDVPTVTPARRFALLGTQRGTPQTVKPYCKPTAPTSETRPMTVARATGKSFVFRDLRDVRPSPRKVRDIISEQEEASFLVDEDIIPMDATPTPEEPIYLESSLEAIASAEDESATANSSMHEERSAGFVAPAALYHEDPDGTVIIHDTAETDEDADVEDSSRDISMIDDIESEEGSVIVHQSPAVATPEKTIQQASILVDFDEHMADARIMPEDHENDILMHPAAMTSAEEEIKDAVAGAEMENDEEHSIAEAGSHRQTLNFNDFIDVAAISEPTAMLSFDQTNARSSFQSPAKSPAVTTSRDTSTVVAQVEENAGHVLQEETAPEVQVPHYALPTIAFDARRKSLPAFSQRTPMKSGPRPSTSDGTTVPGTISSFANAWWNGARPGSIANTPLKRPSTAHATPTGITFGTPSKSRTTTAASSPWIATPKERYPLLSAQKVAAESAVPAPKSPGRRDTFGERSSGPVSPKTVKSGAIQSGPSITATPRERYPVLSGPDSHAKTAAAPARFQTPPAKSPKRRQTFHKAAAGQVNLRKADAEISTPTVTTAATPEANTTERFPRLRPRKDYTEHAKTVAGPVRFQTPVKTPLKRPATGEKSDSLRRAALAANTPIPASTSMKTPLKGPGMTPAQVPMTPHPAAPLRGVVAMVEVFTLEGASASAPFVALLHRLGAKTTRSWSDRITHVVFKDGSPLTLQRVRLNNKEFEESGKGTMIHCVNSRWVTDCDTESARVDESSEEYVVDVSEVPRGGKRRRKSMEPSALMNLGGNIVRDRKSSLGRKSLGRLSFKVDSLAEQPEETPAGEMDVDMFGKENSPDGQSSPATPAWIADPGQLVQQTAPMKRVRKLELPEKEAKNRRLTFWNGAV